MYGCGLAKCQTTPSMVNALEDEEEREINPIGEKTKWVSLEVFQIDQSR